MRIRHFRGNSELPWIINDENYDFNYQTNRRLVISEIPCKFKETDVSMEIKPQ